MPVIVPPVSHYRGVPILFDQPGFDPKRVADWEVVVKQYRDRGFSRDTTYRTLMTLANGSPICRVNGFPFDSVVACHQRLFDAILDGYDQDQVAAV
jgi:hypothetical protein